MPNKRRKTFTVSMSDMDKVWPYTTQALRAISNEPMRPERVAEQLTAYYKRMPAGYRGPAWFGIGATPWSTWTNTRIDKGYSWQQNCYLSGPNWTLSDRFSVFEKNYPRLYEVWEILKDFEFDEKNLTVMLKSLLLAPLCDAPHEDQAGRPGIKTVLTELHALGLPAIFLVDALKDAFSPEATPAMLLPGMVSS